MSKIGYGVTRQEIPEVIKNLLDRAEKDGYIIPEDRKFVDNRPSRNWLLRFLKRHPMISPRTPENLGFQRTYVTKERIYEWFADLEKYLDEEHNIDAKEFFVPGNAQRVFNLDESGFPLQGTNQRLQVIGVKGSKNIYRIAPDSKEQVTVLACVFADGHFQKPLVLFPGVRTPKFHFGTTSADDYSLGNSANGWMTADVFFTWLSSIFYPDIKDRVQFPIIVFLDSHTSHINLAVADFCVEHNIILYCFPPHASHVLQPLDVAVFGPVKKHWNKALEDFRGKFKVSVTRTHFFPVFDQAWKAAIANVQNVISGFRSCGLLPFNVENVNFGKVLDKAAAANHNERMNANINDHATTRSYERLGVMKVFQMIESKLPREMKENFETRWAEEFDIEEETYKGILWSIYKGSRKMLDSFVNMTPHSNTKESSAFKANSEAEPRAHDVPSFDNPDEETSITVEVCDVPDATA